MPYLWLTLSFFIVSLFLIPTLPRLTMVKELHAAWDAHALTRTQRDYVVEITTAAVTGMRSLFGIMWVTCMVSGTWEGNAEILIAGVAMGLWTGVLYSFGPLFVRTHVDLHTDLTKVELA